MCRALRDRLQRAGDHRIDSRIVNAARCAGTWRIQQPLQAVFDKARSPLGDGLGRDPLANGNGLVLHPLGTTQHDACSQCHGLRGLAPQRQRGELFALRIAEHQFRLGSASHDHLVVFEQYTTDSNGQY